MSPESTPVFVGIDLHSKTARVAVLRGWDRDFYDERTLPADVVKIRRYLQRLGKHGEVRACYEASGSGYVLQRALAKAGISCVVVAPSLIARKPGERRKTDRIDACKLARQLRNGDLVAVRIPTQAEESVRELVRCRQSVRSEIHRSRQHILKLLARRDVHRPQGRAWTVAFWQWLRKLELPGPDQMALRTYLQLLDMKLLYLAELDAELERLAQQPEYRERVARLRCLRGIDTLTAMVLVTEIGDVQRFASARQLMSYVGLAVAESSSGETSRRFGLTKTGSARCRHVLVEAAWHYLRQPNRSRGLLDRQKGQPAEVIAHAWRAQHRLHKRFKRLEMRMPRPKAAAAVARELVGFVWALLHDDPRVLEPAACRR